MSAYPTPVRDVRPEGTPPGASPVSLDLTLAEELRRAQDAILARPRLSITLRLVTSLTLCFLLSTAFALATMWILWQVREKQHALDAIERVSFQVSQADDLVREASPGQDELREARQHLDAALSILEDGGPGLTRGVGEVEIATLARQLAEVRTALVDNEDSLREPASIGMSARAQLRSHAAAANRDVESLLAVQHGSLERLLKTSERAPLAFVAVLLVLFAVITAFFASALVSPIRRFQSYTTRIAAGDFALIAPSRAYRDEFSDLALAVNQMLAELQAHQDRCVRAGKLAAVGTIASGIAHELANPLNNISITTEALLEDLPTLSDEEKWKLLQDVYFETERASEIVKSLLDFTRQEKPQMVALDLGEVIRSTFRLVQNEMTINNVTLVDEVTPGLPQVRGAANQLRQVFLNLFLNAIQAMPRGGNVTVRVTRHEAERVCAEVQDEGVGIPPEVLPHIFDPFFTTKEPGKGTGLGLSVSYSIIKKFGGDIQVRSETGRGTLFHVCLPIAGEQ